MILQPTQLAPDSPWHSEERIVILGTFKILFDLTSHAREFLIYEDIYPAEHTTPVWENDLARSLNLVPNNPKKLLALIAKQTLEHSEFWEAHTERSLLRTLEYLQSYVRNLGIMGHLIVAGGMVCSNKTGRLLSGEIWIQGVDFGTIDSEKLGEYLGKHMNPEFIPAKRFTDLVNQTLSKISNRHSRALFVMMEKIIKEIDNVDMRGLRMVLEIFLNLVDETKQTPSKQIQDKLQAWKEKKSLRKVVGLIEKRM